MNLYDYLQSNDNYFWKWAENCTVIEIPEGNTIAYAQPVKDLLLRMADSGLPSFGCILLTLIATGKMAADSLHQVKQIIASNNRSNELSKVFSENESILNEAFSFLNMLKDVPQQYLNGDNKLQLLYTIFSEAHNKLSVKKSKKLVDAAHGYIDIDLLSKTTPFYQGLVSRDFKTLALLHRQFPSVNAVLEKMANLPKDNIDINHTEDESLREVKKKDFVDELIENPKTFHVGSLLKPLWAGFKIPINTTMPSQQPFGGISDVTNKGDFDKLLISEFAHDDLTFMSRLANNEALYLHREMPPAVDDQQRILLIDISLMSWGTPKTLAHACSIAISRHPKALSESKAFVVGQSYKEVYFDTVDAIIDATQITDSSLHPAKGMDLFLKEYNGSKKPEIFLMITPDALKKPAVQRVLADYVSLFKYIVTVEKDGIVSFYTFKAGNRKLQQQITLNLRDHWRKLPVTINTPERPSAENRYPILFAAPQHISRALMIGKQDLYIVSDKMLFKRLDLNNKGYALMANNITAQKFSIGKYKNGATHFLSFNPQNRALSILNLETKETAAITFDHWRGMKVDFFFLDDKRYPTGFYHFNNTGLYCFSLKDNKIVTNDVRIDLPDLRIIMAKEEEEHGKLQKIRSHASVIRNIKTIGINARHQLCFNRHELSLNNGKVTMGENQLEPNLIAEATYHIKDGKYVFRDGSIVTVHPAGMFILKSSNKLLKDIYIPSVLNAGIGIATDQHFCGNDYYNPFSGKEHQLYSVFLEDAGSSKLDIIKAIKETTDLSLRQLQEIVESRKSELLKTNMSYYDAYNFHNKLIQTGAKTKVTMIDESDTQERHQTVAIDYFDDVHLKPFIQNILRHAGTS